MTAPMTAPQFALRLALAFGLHAFTALAGNAAPAETADRPTPVALIATGEALLTPAGITLSGGQSPHGTPATPGVNGALDL